MAQLVEDYDYTTSKTFLDSVHGSSAAVTNMKRKIAQEPANRKMHQQEFIQSLLGLPENRDAYVLLADTHHETLNKILIAFAEISPCQSPVALHAYSNAEPAAPLDPQSAVVQGSGVLIGSPLIIAGE